MTEETKLDPYIPTEEDKQYIRNVMGMLKDGGIFGYPRSGLLYMKVSDNKIRIHAAMTEASIPEELKDQLESQQAQDRHATFYVCKALGIELDDSLVGEN